MTPDKTHLTFGGSTAHRWLRCAGSVKLCATLPPQAENEHMAAGTRAHALLEMAVRERRDDVLDFDGVSLQSHWPAFGLDDVAAVQAALDYINALLARDPGHMLFVERQVTLFADVGGTADVLIYLPATRALHVIDYKHGRRYVEAEGNPQLKLYAAAALFGFTEGPVETIHGTIIQPRAFAGEPIRTAVYGPADLISYSDDVDAAVAAALAPDPAFTAGEEQCHWCPAGHVCPALRDTATAVVALPPEAGERLPAGDEIKLILPPPGACRDAGTLALAMQAAGVLRTWIDAVEDAAVSLAMSGETLPGFKLVEKRPTRKWADEDVVRQWFAGSTMIDEDDYAPRKLVSPAQAEKLVKAGGGKDGVKALAEHVVKESSGLKLVPETAKGDAINPLQLAAAGFSGAVTIEG